MADTSSLYAPERIRQGPHGSSLAQETLRAFPSVSEFRRLSDVAASADSAGAASDHWHPRRVLDHRPCSIQFLTKLRELTDLVIGMFRCLRTMSKPQLFWLVAVRFRGKADAPSY
jgi:hypothetical protein